MAFTLSPKQLKIGTAYDFSDSPDGLTHVHAERVASEPGEGKIMLRLLEDRKDITGAVIAAKGTRFQCPPQWRARLQTPEARLMSDYPLKEVFQKRVFIQAATPGTEYTFLLPGKAMVNPVYMFIATLLEAEIDYATLLTVPFMRLKVRLAPEFQKAWGLDDPVVEWESVPSNLPIFEVPKTRVHRDFAKKLALMNASAQLPIEMLGELMKFVNADFKGGPYPERAFATARKDAMREKQAELIRQQKDFIASLPPGEREAAAASLGGRRKKTRRRRQKSRRRN